VRLAPFGVELRAVRRSPWEAAGGGTGGRADADADAATALLVGKGVAATDMRAMLGDADAVVLACNQTADNRGMVDDAFLAAMTPGKEGGRGGGYLTVSPCTSYAVYPEICLQRLEEQHTGLVIHR
jgi:hypothetical protein